MAERVSGVVEHIIFRNEDNGYTVLSLVSEGKELTLVGFFQSVSEGVTMEAEGRYTSHAAYGEQFKVDSYEIRQPEGRDGIERYLSSGAIKGVGKALAARIVKKFGEDTLRIIEEEPERLVEIRGISERIARDIARQAADQKNMRQAMMFLQQYDISISLGVRIYREYGEKLYDILKENPYRLADDIDGVGFKTADVIAARIGIDPDSEYRIRSGILYTLSMAAGEGSVYLPERQLIRRCAAMLGTAEELVERQITSLALERKIMLRDHERRESTAHNYRESLQADVSGDWEDDFYTGYELYDMPDRDEEGRETERIVYSSHYYYLELNTARMLTDLSIQVRKDGPLLESSLDRLKQDRKITLDEDQENAIRCAAKNGLLILTGGPGTGKTTTINEMLRYFQLEEMNIRLAAPTGRAAKRMTETTGFEASTIHRLLEFGASGEELGEREEVHFERNATNPLEADVIIIDEMSMVDISLMHALLSAVTAGTRLVLVGDVDQLPSVGPGSVLRDMIRADVFPCVRLHHIFRQAATSDIVVNAHKINAGEAIRLDNKSRDFFFLRRSDVNLIISNIIQLVRDKLPPYVEATPFDIQVLSPMRKGPLGTIRLNRILQTYLNPASADKAEKTFGDRIFRVGDKVMQIRNNYQLAWEVRGRYGTAIATGEGIFNGDMGVVRSMNDYSASMTIEFDDGRMVDYPYADLEELEHAYAVTIHKSQGSEYPAVIIPLLTGPPMLMTRNLLYTAVTRARKCVTVLGSEETVRSMIDNASELERYTSLDERILELCSISEIHGGRG